MYDVGWRVSGLRFGVWVQGLGFRIQGSGCRVQGLGSDRKVLCFILTLGMLPLPIVPLGIVTLRIVALRVARYRMLLLAAQGLGFRLPGLGFRV